MCSAKRFLILIILTGASLLYAEKTQEAVQTVKVGIFPFAPFCFLTENNEADGLFPDLLEKISKEENWRIEFRYGTWSEGLARLKSGEIDLMTCVAYSEERDEFMDYNSESVAELWTQVFLARNLPSQNITDLEGKAVGIMTNDMNGTNFLDTAARFGVQADIRYYNSHEDIFAALSRGQLFAGVAPQHYGLRNAKSYGVIPSSIIFSPFSIFLTTQEDINGDLLESIDFYLKLWKNDNSRIYYDALNRWLGNDDLVISRVPRWLVILITSIAVLLFLMSLYLFSLKVVLKKNSKELLRQSEELRQSEKLSSLGNLAGGVAHDFNNQLLAISGFAELIIGEAENDQDNVRNYAESILKSVGKSADLTRKLLAFARKGGREKKIFDLNRLLEELASIMRRSIDKSINLKLDLCGGDFPVSGDWNQLEHALLNLLLNARDAMPSGGDIDIKSGKIDITAGETGFVGGESPKEGSYSLIKIRDNGTGIPEEHHNNIFDPFFTTKEMGKGTGMGLPSVYGTVKEHSGYIRFSSEINRGTTFFLYLPIP